MSASKESSLVDNVEIGARVRSLRKEKDLSKEKLAEIVGYTPSQIGLIESGNRGMSASKSVAVADAFGISLDYLLRGKSTEPIGSKEVMATLDKIKALRQQRESLNRKRAELDAQIERIDKDEDFLLAELAFRLRSS